MYDYAWDRFTQTGQIMDYLQYKGCVMMQTPSDQVKEVQESHYAGICNADRDSNQIRAYEGIR